MPDTANSLLALVAAGCLAPVGVAQGPAADLAPMNTPGPVYSHAAPRTQQVGASVIYTNGPYVTHVGGGFGGLDASLLQNTTLGHNFFGHSANGASAGPADSFRLADDFTVPAGQMWYVQSVKVHSYRLVVAGSSPITFTDGVCRIWDAPPNGAANVVFGDVTTNRLVASTFDNCYRAFEATPLNNQRGVVESELAVGKLFGPGTYWVEWGVNDATLGNVFAPPITIPGQFVTGDGLQLDVNLGAWNRLESGPLGARGPQGVPFQLCGEIACCWESNKGPNLNLGDDQLSPVLALPFAFRMPGALVGGATTNSIKVCSNGFVWLDSAQTSADLSPSVLEFTTLAARIGCPWDDFYPPGGGSVNFTTTASRAIATWHRIDTFGGLVTRSRIQLQMFPNGQFTINTWVHEPVTPRTPILGVSAGLGAASAAIDISAGHVGTPGVATIYEMFASGASDLSGKVFVFTPRDDGVAATYDIAVLPSCGAVATQSRIAPGCAGMTTVVTSRAIAGSNLVLDSTMTNAAAFGLTALGLVPTPNGIPLGGTLGCFVHHSNDLGTVGMTLGVGGFSGNSTVALPCLSEFLGLTICSQGAALAVGPISPLPVMFGDALLTPLGTDG